MCQGRDLSVELVDFHAPPLRFAALIVSVIAVCIFPLESMTMLVSFTPYRAIRQALNAVAAAALFSASVAYFDSATSSNCFISLAAFLSSSSNRRHRLSVAFADIGSISVGWEPIPQGLSGESWSYKTGPTAAYRFLAFSFWFSAPLS